MSATVIGLGNDARHDDAAGLEVARRLSEHPESSGRVVVGLRDVTELVELLSRPDPIVVVDAMRSGRSPGTVVRWEATGAAAPPGELAVSTHGLSLPEALRLAEALGYHPVRLVVYGIESSDLSMGQGMSPAVERGVEEAVGRILDELGRTLAPSGPAEATHA